MADRRTYIDGNTVRKLDVITAPKRQNEPQRKNEPERELSPKTRKKIDRVLAFDLKYTMALVVAIGFTFWACVTMLSVQAQINTQKKKIAALASDYQNLKNDNDALDTKLNSDVDLDALKKVAMEELGMIYPGAGQIITYERAEEQYVKQYQDVPGLD